MRRQPRPLAAWLAALVLGSIPYLALAAETRPTAVSVGCGLQALYILLRLEGRHVPLERLEPPRPRPNAGEGLSLTELRDLAAREGLALSIERIRHVDRPMIVHLNTPPSGHYVVMRPLPHSRRLIQVIDGRRDPVLASRELWQNTPAWSGYALVPRPPLPNRPLVLWAALPLALLALAHRINRRVAGTTC